MKKELILISNHGGGYYNGSTDDGWSYEEVERTEDISSENMFETLEDIQELPEYDTKLCYWYKVAKISEQTLKPPCPYPRNITFKPIIKKGCKNETCAYCGTNILAKEPYLVWRQNKKYCLHCVMSQIDNVVEIFGSTPADLKEEWIANGKEKTIKCLEHMLKNVDGSNV